MSKPNENRSGPKKSDSDSTQDKPSCSERCRSSGGLLLALLGAALLAVSNLLIKWLGADADSTQVVLARAWLQYIWLVPHLTLRGERIVRPRMRTNALLLARGVLGMMSGWSLVLSLKFVPLGDAVAIQYTHVVMVGLFAHCCLNEICGFADLLLSLFTLVGLTFVAQPTFLFPQSAAPNTNMSPQAVTRAIGIMFAFASAVLTACTYVVVRKMGSGVHFSLSLFYYTTITIIASAVSLLASAHTRMSCLGDLGLMVASGVAGFAAQIVTTMALQREAAGPVTLVGSSQVIFAFLLQFLFFGGQNSWPSIVGAVLILSCAVALTGRKIFNKES